MTLEEIILKYKDRKATIKKHIAQYDCIHVDEYLVTEILSDSFSELIKDLEKIE